MHIYYRMLYTSLFFAAMSTTMFQRNDKVKLLSSILEVSTIKSNHHIFEQIIREDRTCEVVNYESSERRQGIWIKFHFGKILIEECHLCLA